MHIRRGNKTILAIEIAFLLTAVIYFALLLNAPDFIRYPYIICVLLFFCIFSYRRLGYPEDNNFLKAPVIKLLIANALLFSFILFFVGAFVNFTVAYRPTAETFITKIFPFFIIALEIEFFRYVIIGKVEHNIPVIVAFTLISDTLFLANIPHEVAAVGNNVVIITTIILTVRILATGFICSYLSHHFGFVPALIYRLIVTIGMLLMPVWPDNGPVLALIFAIAFPFFTFIVVRHHELFAERNHAKARLFNLSFFSLPVIIILAFFVVLNTGVTGYEILAIASNSMHPTYDRGDIVIYERVDASEVNANDILVFKRGNRLITHRVAYIRESAEGRRFIVKGDNNALFDEYSVSADDVRGIVRVVGHYIGYPALLFNGVSEETEE